MQALNSKIIETYTLFDRVDELNEELSQIAVYGDEDETREMMQELETLETLMASLQGQGDESWNGQQYPSTLIKKGHFVSYAKDLALRSGDLDINADWLVNSINWEAAASELALKYGTLSVGGSEFYYI